MAPGIHHCRLAVAEALDVIVTKIDRADFIFVVQVFQELQVFPGRRVIIVGFLPAGIKQKLPFLIIQTLVDGAVRIPIEIESGLGHFAAVPFGELLCNCTELIPGRWDISVGKPRFFPQLLVVVDIACIDNGINILDLPILIFVH